MPARLFQWILVVLMWGAGNAHALTATQARAIAAGETDARIEALNQSLADADEKTAAFIQALADDAVKIAGEQVFIVRGGQGVDPVTGVSVTLPEGAEDAMLNNRMRGELDIALAALKLFSKDDKVRGAAIATLLSETDETKAALIDKALAAESRADFK